MKAYFSPTMMTHFKGLHNYKIRLSLPCQGFNLMFFSLNHIRGLFSSPAYHSFLNFLSLSNSFFFLFFFLMDFKRQIW